MDVPAASSGRKAPGSASKNDTLRRRRKSDVNAEHTAVGYIEYTVMPSPREETYSIHTPRGRPRPRPPSPSRRAALLSRSQRPYVACAASWS
jgi:hypothetical protein